MPSWCWTDVLLACDNAEQLHEFMASECDSNGFLRFEVDSAVDRQEALGFDGFVANDNSQLHFSETRKILGSTIPTLSAYFETRWTPPYNFFEHIAAKYTNIQVYMRVNTEDDQWPAPNGWFKVNTPELNTGQ